MNIRRDFRWKARALPAGLPALAAVRRELQRAVAIGDIVLQCAFNPSPINLLAEGFQDMPAFFSGFEANILGGHLVSTGGRYSGSFRVHFFLLLDVSGFVRASSFEIGVKHNS